VEGPGVHEIACAYSTQYMTWEPRSKEETTVMEVTITKVSLARPPKRVSFEE
jgi:hypothetical protein